jgi:hypothetical protein
LHGAEGAAGTPAILDHNGLGDPLRQRIGDDAANDVDAGARAERDGGADKFVLGPPGRKSGPYERGSGNRSGREFKKASASGVHCSYLKGMRRRSIGVSNRKLSYKKDEEKVIVG